MDEEDYPQLPKKQKHEIDPDFDATLEVWTAKRNAVAQELDLEPTIIATRYQLEAIAAHPEKGLGHLMQWQQDLLSK